MALFVCRSNYVAARIRSSKMSVVRIQHEEESYLRLLCFAILLCNSFFRVTRKCAMTENGADIVDCDIVDKTCRQEVRQDMSS